MTILPIRKDVTSAQLARVEEVTDMRHFTAQNDGEETPARVVYDRRGDCLYCARCEELDNCTHTARVRLSGILTNTVTKNARPTPRQVKK